MITARMNLLFRVSFNGGLALSVVMLLTNTAARAADAQDIANNGNGRGAHPCSSCHGSMGEGRPLAAYPRLAGLSAPYIEHQLNDFASGKRDNETMHQIAKALSPDERAAVAAFYARNDTPSAGEPKPADAATLAAGKHLADQPTWSKGLPACNQCHGPGGQGVGSTFPRLAAQSSAYIINQLKAWQEGKRGNDPLNLMTGIASKLDQSQIAAVAAYYASLPPAKPMSEDNGADR